MNATERWTGVVSSGHKSNAVEVPFDPAERWSLAAVPLHRGRRGWPVDATIGDAPSVTTAIVARAKRFWLLVPPERDDIAAGDVVALLVSPRFGK